MTLKVQHKRSAVKGKAPLPTDLEYGEIAVNYEATDPALYIKDSADAVRKIGTQPAATETAAGIVELATAAETTTGTDATRAVHPAGLKVELDKKAAKTVTSDTAPTNPADGDLWYDSVGGELYVWYDSDDAGAVAGTWVQANPQPTPKQATASVAGVVQLADAAAITAGTAGRVVDAAQLKAKSNITYGPAHMIFTDPASGRRIMHCWGSPDVATTGTTVTYPFPFKALIAVNATPVTNTNFAAAATPVINQASGTGFVMFTNAGGANIICSVCWSAIGELP